MPRPFQLAAAIVLACLTSVPSRAQDAAATFPNRTVRIVVPFPAGGPSDILARLLGERMSAEWGQPVVIENRPGGNTAIGAVAVARSEPDGYTLLAAMDTTLVMHPLMAANPGYDPFKDFTYVGLTSRNTILLTVPASGPGSVKELIEKARANPGKMNYGGGVVTNRLGGFLFAQSAGIQAQLIPYNGSAQVIQALLAGSIDFAADGPAANVPLIQGGKVRALAKLSNSPLPSLPDVPLLSQAAGFVFEDVSTWTSLVAPAGTPRAVAEKIQAKIAAIYADPAFVKRLETAGISIATNTPAELETFVRHEAARWSKVLRESNVKFE